MSYLEEEGERAICTADLVVEGQCLFKVSITVGFEEVCVCWGGGDVEVHGKEMKRM